MLPLVLCKGRGQETILCVSKPRRGLRLLAHCPGTTALQTNTELTVRLFCLSAAALKDALSLGTSHLSFPAWGWCRSTLTHTLISQGAISLAAPPATGQLGWGLRPAASVSVLCPTARGDESELVTDGAVPSPAPFPLGHQGSVPFSPDHAGCSSADSGSTSTATEAAELPQNSHLPRRGAGLAGG